MVAMPQQRSQQAKEIEALPCGYVIYTKPDCRMCQVTKALLRYQDKQYIEKDLTEAEVGIDVQRRAVVKTGTDAPQIFFDNKHIGGFLELFSKLDMVGSVEDFVKFKCPEIEARSPLAKFKKEESPRGVKRSHTRMMLSDFMLDDFKLEEAAIAA